MKQINLWEENIMRKKIVAAFIMCSMIGSLCLNGCAESETEQSLETMEETQEEIAEAEKSEESQEAIEAQNESKNEKFEIISEENNEIEEKKVQETIAVNISKDNYEYIFGENPGQKFFGVNLEPEDEFFLSGGSLIKMELSYITE